MTTIYLPPRPHGGKPRTPFPVGACDCHADIFGDPTIYPMLAAYPFHVVLDHMAQLSPNPAKAEQQLDKLEQFLDGGKTWIKLTTYRCSTVGCPFEDTQWLIRRLATSFLEHCIRGSDWPNSMLAKMMPYDGELLDLFASCVKLEVRRRVLVINSSILYDF